MIKRWIIVGIAIIGAGWNGACDDKPAVPQAVLEQSNQAPQPKSKKPTTQELLDGHRSHTALIPLPLTMELPPGWGKLDELSDAGLKVSGANLLQGYTPRGEVQIQLANRPALKQEDLDRLVAAGKKEQKERPQQIIKFELRPLGNVKVLERQSVGQAGPYVVYDSKNQPHETIESPFSWTISVLVPNEGAYQLYELNFIGLTKSQYDHDRDFLDSILHTLAYAGDTSVTSLPPAATLPSSTDSSSPARVPTGIFGNPPSSHP